jgi:hypothetical protein
MFPKAGDLAVKRGQIIGLSRIQDHRALTCILNSRQQDRKDYQSHAIWL